MDKDRLEGVGKKASGSIKKAIGKLTGDQKAQADGETEKVTGKVQNTVGGVKDTVRNAVDK